MTIDIELRLSNLKEKLADLDSKIQNKPNARHLKYIRKTYVQAINSAERTLDVVGHLDPIILNTVVRLKKMQES